MFGVKVGALENGSSENVQSFRRISEIFMLRMSNILLWPDFIFRFTKLGREMNDCLGVLHSFTTNIIQEKKKRYLRGEKEQNCGKRKALLDMLLERHIEAGELGEEDIREEVDTFALAGHETVSTTIIWTLYLIGLHPEIQAKIHEELDRVFGGDFARPISEEDLSQLQYLERVLKETNRLCPAVPLFGRNIPETTEICGQTLPKGTSCIVLTYFLHRDEEVFPNPEKFDPDRFSPEKCLKIPELAYVPFGAGPRNCIGQRFALMEIKTLVSSILRNFTIESLDPRDKILSFIYITLRPSSPIRIRIRPRKNQKSW
ncbi:Cytochrome P450 4C1 [Araneus ventricosus]|uniref:Cytochrome P450 4C1 n=2 Tax=Araneus ventricosus TaxID=182803 RepID=A0A4Y2PGR4_ARAVE|nr:Cytochrome P450 4C1 [Araneus ventricosus]